MALAAGVMKPPPRVEQQAVASDERAIGVAEGTARWLTQRRDVSREVIEIRAATSVRRAQRRIRRLTVLRQARAAEEAHDVVFKVLNLVEVRAPMHRAVRHAGAP